MTIHAKSLANRDIQLSRGVLPSEDQSPLRKIHTVPVKSAVNVIREASRKINPFDLCEAVELAPDSLHHTDGRIPFRQLVALYEAAARLTGEGGFGLHVGAKTDLHAFGLLGYIVTNSATLGDALANASRYFPLWTTGARFHVEQSRSDAQVIWEYSDPHVAHCRQDCEMTLLTASRITRLLCRSGVGAREVHFQHSPPRDSSDHKRLFGSVLHFRMPANQLIFDRAALASGMKGADQQLFKLLVRYADDLLVALIGRSSFPDLVRAALRQSLLNRDTQVQTVARRMGLSTRTLQRQLRAQGSSFRGLLSGVRRELAEQYLRDPALGIDEVAYFLNFSQTSEFHRAFQAWTGTTPRRYRSSVTRA